jgi:hyperosmotically inducible protein
MWRQLSRIQRTSATAMAALIVCAVTAIHADGQSSAGRPAAPAQADARAAGQNPVKDGWITFKIHSSFVPEAALEGSDIDVDTNAGIVSLTGTVPSEAGRTRAMAIAKATDGVRNVVDKLQVAPAAGSTARDAGDSAAAAARAAGRSVNDGWIKSKIYAQFLADWNLFEDSDIDVDVTKGAVVLSGSVESEAARARAVALAKQTDGVTSVKDTLKVQ